jgi:hypothetical protein
MSFPRGLGQARARAGRRANPDTGFVAEKAGGAFTPTMIAKR